MIGISRQGVFIKFLIIFYMAMAERPGNIMIEKAIERVRVGF
jgi:hypothetical protein